MVDFICMSLLELQVAKTEIYKMKNSGPQRDWNSRSLNHKATTVTIRISRSDILSTIQTLTSRLQIYIVLFIATSSHSADCCNYMIRVSFCCLTNRYWSNSKMTSIRYYHHLIKGMSGKFVKTDCYLFI